MNFKTFEMVQQIKYLNYNNIDEFIERIENLTQLNKYAFIIHDKDEDENKQLKEPHIHLVVQLKNQMTEIQISNVLKVEPQYINKIKTTTRKAYEYLIHKNDDTKYKYDAKNVVSNFDYIKYINDEDENKIKVILDKIVNGEYKQYNICDNISYNSYIKYNKQIKLALEYRQKILQGGKREMECMYIYGDSGVGKTTYARSIAKTYVTILNDKDYYISSSGTHMLDDYGGQSVIILDDIRASDISVSELLKLLDNNTNSLVNCRYFNKSIYECKLIIITSTIAPRLFFSQCKNSNDEDVKQLLRRLLYFIEMTKDEIRYYNYDINKDIDYQKLTMPNTIKQYYNKVENEEKDKLEKLKNITINFNGV